MYKSDKYILMDQDLLSFLSILSVGLLIYGAKLIYSGYRAGLLNKSDQEDESNNPKNIFQRIFKIIVYVYNMVFHQNNRQETRKIVRLYHPNGKTIYQKIFNHKDLFNVNRSQQLDDENMEEEEEKKEDNNGSSGSKRKEYEIDYEHVLPDSLEPYGARMIKKNQKSLFISQSTDTNNDFKEDESEEKKSFRNEEEENADLLQTLVKNAIELYNNNNK